jgi:hypothetical protein
LTGCAKFHHINYDSLIFGSCCQITGDAIFQFGICNVPVLDQYPELKQACFNKGATLQMMLDEFMNDIPDVPFSYIQSKQDIVQQSFYVMIALTYGVDASLTPEQFYSAVNGIFGDYNKKHPNFLSYLVDGEQHCFTGFDFYYSANTTGNNNLASSEVANSVQVLDPTVPLMHAWCNSFPMQDGATVSSQCTGSLVPNMTGVHITDDDASCAQTVIPKSFVEHYQL